MFGVCSFADHVSFAGATIGCTLVIAHGSEPRIYPMSAVDDRFADDIEIAIATFADEHEITREEAIERILRDWLEENGFMPIDPLSN